MNEKLTKQEQTFVAEVIETGNQTKAAQKAFKIKDPNYAGVKGHDLIRKPKIVNAIQEALPDDLLAQVHVEGLQATKGEEVDYFARHKYLDTAYKLKGSYAPEKSINMNVTIEPSDRVKELADELLHKQRAN